MRAPSQCTAYFDDLGKFLVNFEVIVINFLYLKPLPHPIFFSLRPFSFNVGLLDQFGNME